MTKSYIVVNNGADTIAEFTSKMLAAEFMEWYAAAMQKQEKQISLQMFKKTEKLKPVNWHTVSTL